MLKTFFILNILLGGLFVLEAEAQVGKALSFKEWKKEKVKGASQKVIRLSNEVLALKARMYKQKSVDQLMIQRKPTAAENKVIQEKQKKLDKAVLLLESKRKLSMKDYMAGYLAKYKKDPKSLQKVAERFKPLDIVQLFKVFWKMDEAHKSSELGDEGLKSSVSIKKKPSNSSVTKEASESL